MVILLSAITGSGFGQDDLLRGPDIGSQEQQTIVRHTMYGDFEEVEGAPEMSAFAAIVNDPELNERAIRIELDRTIRLAMLLVDEIDLMRESTDAIRDGDQERAREIQSKFHEMLDPGKPHDPMSGPLGELLDDDQRDLYEKMLEEYWDAWVQWSLRNRDGKITDRMRENTRARLTLRLFQREMNKAYEMSLRHYREALEAVYAAVDPTDEQRQEIRSIVIDHIKATRLGATPANRREVMHTIYNMLDDERRVKLYDYLLRIVVPDVD